MQRNSKWSLDAIGVLVTLALGLLTKATPASDIQQAEAAETTAPRASLTGRIVYEGPIPERAPLRIPLTRGVRDPGGKTRQVEDPSALRASKLGLQDETLIVGPDGGVANVFVWLNSRWLPPVEPRPLPPLKALVVAGRFEPRALAYWNIRKVEWINTTDEAVNINWQPPGGMAMNPLIEPGNRFVHAVGNVLQIPSPVRSNLQPWMQAYVLPLPHPYFAVTDEEGRFEIRDLPPGRWEFALWHERPGWLANDNCPKGRFTLTVGDKKIEVGDLRFLPASFERRPPAPAAAARAIADRARPDLSPLQIAARDGDTAQVRTLLDEGVWIEARGRDGSPPLQMAAANGHADIVQLLLARGATVDARDGNKRTALISAAQKGHADVVGKLLDAGAAINVTDTSGFTALDYANVEPQAEQIRRLLVDRGAKTHVQLEIRDAPKKVPKIDQTDDRGFAPLHDAAKTGKLDLMRGLLEKGANVEVQQDMYHGTPLQYAAYFASGDAVQLLLDHHAKVDARDTQGRTPLMWAAMKGKVDSMRRLLDAGADVNAKNVIGWTALHFATNHRHAEACRLLIDRGANLEAKNNAGQTPAQVAPDREMP